MQTRRGRWLAAAVLAAAVGIIWLAPVARTAAFLLDLTDHFAALRAWLPSRSYSVSSTQVTIDTRSGPIQARVYAPDRPAPTVVLFPGIHDGGGNEARLVHFSSNLARAGVRVVAVPLPDLRAFRISSRSTDEIEDVTAWASATLAGGAPVGIVGISFGGGLAVVAAGRPRLAKTVSAVVSVGGHGDVERTLTYLATGELRDGMHRPPHDYAVAVAALAAAPHLVPRPWLGAVEGGIQSFLQASGSTGPPPLELLDTADKERLPRHERDLLRAVFLRDVSSTGAWFRPAIPQMAADAAISPERSPTPRVPVFLLHGAQDNVIPPSETLDLVRYLRHGGNDQAYALVTPLLTHVDIDPTATWRDYWRFLLFWTEARLRILGTPTH